MVSLGIDVVSGATSLFSSSSGAIVGLLSCSDRFVVPQEYNSKELVIISSRKILFLICKTPYININIINIIQLYYKVAQKIKSAHYFVSLMQQIIDNLM
jgi:hypothetical protein